MILQICILRHLCTQLLCFKINSYHGTTEREAFYVTVQTASPYLLYSLRLVFAVGMVDLI